MKLDNHMRILVVDDFSTMRMVVINQLKELGFSELDQAVDGVDAWEKIQTSTYDLIVSDWNMPNMMGIELLQRIRADRRFGFLPFILITAEAKRSQILEAMSAGVDAYITKPFNAATLYQKIHEVFCKRDHGCA